MDLRALLEAHRDLIKDRLDPDFGLLDELLSSGSLTREDIASVKAVQTTFGRSEKVLEYVFNRGICEKFLDALRDTQQTHLTNFILSNGVLSAVFGDDWPLTAREISILDKNQRSLVDLLETCDLLRDLYSHKVINNRQRDFVSSKSASHEKNDALLDILRRTSLQDYNKTIYCLNLSKQSHIADVLTDGGVVVRVHSELETEGDVNEVEDELITKITDLVGDRSLEDAAHLLECAQLRLIAAKKGNSIILYLFCKTSTEIVHLQEMQTLGKLLNVVKQMFNEILSRAMVITVRTTFCDEDLLKCELGYRELGIKGELEKNSDIGDKDDQDEEGASSASNTTVIGQEKMTFGGGKVEKQYGEIKKCTICLKEVTDPMVLPCNHTFCCECLNFSAKDTNQETEDKMPCPLCRKESIVQTEGATGSHSDFSVAVVAKRPEKNVRQLTECSICLKEFTVPKVLPCIHTFCFECIKRTAETAEKKPGDKMPCPLCRKEFTIPREGIVCLQRNFYMENLMEHISELNTTLQSNDIILKRGSQTEEEEIKRLSNVKSCDKHINIPLDYYCTDCKKIICVSCIFESHRFHDCIEMTTFDEECRETIDKKAKMIFTFMNERLSMKHDKDKRKANFLKRIAAIEEEINNKSQKLKDMIDQNTRSLLDELSVIKSNNLKEMENQMEEIETGCTILSSFEAYCNELTSKGSTSDICSSVDQVIRRANELEFDHKTFIDCPHQVTFRAPDLSEVLHMFNNNLVGNIKETTTTFENWAIVVGLGVGQFKTRDVIKINLHRPNEISKLEQIPTVIDAEAFAAVYNNTMYVTGIGDKYDEIWKYNVFYGWKKCASLVQCRRSHNAAFIDEVLYICGGFVDSDKSVLDSVEAYNSDDDKCAQVGKLVHCVYCSGNCVPFRSSLYIFSGLDKDKKALNCVQVYNTQQNTCTLLTKRMPYGYYLMRAVLWDTSVILVGCYTCFIYNIETETWQERNQFGTDVAHFGLVLENERIFVIGGGIDEEDKDGKDIWICRDDVRYVPLQNIIDDKPIEWKMHGKLPKPSLVKAYANLGFLV